MSLAFGEEVRAEAMILRSHLTVLMTMELGDITQGVNRRKKRSKTEVA